MLKSKNNPKPLSYMSKKNTKDNYQKIFNEFKGDKLRKGYYCT